MSGIHRHGWDLAHAGCRPGWWRLRGPTANQVVERWSTLNESVQSFLDARVVKIDTRSSAGRPRTTWCDWHVAWWAITLGSSWRRAWHGWTGLALGRGRAKGTVDLGLWGGSREWTSSSSWHSSTTVEQAEDLSLQLLLVAGVSWGTWTSWYAKVAGLWRCVNRMGWRKSCSWVRDVMMWCCRRWSMDWSCGVISSVKNVMLCGRQHCIQHRTPLKLTNNLIIINYKILNKDFLPAWGSAVLLNSRALLSFRYATRLSSSSGVTNLPGDHTKKNYSKSSFMKLYEKRRLINWNLIW